MNKEFSLHPDNLSDRPGETERPNKIQLLVNGTDKSLFDLVALLNSGNLYQVVGFISEDSKPVSGDLFGLPIYSPEEVRESISSQSLFQVILIDPRTMDRGEKLALSDLCIENNIELFSVPDRSDREVKPVRDLKLQKVTIEELLERIPIEIDVLSITENLQGKTVLVTGAAGSIGSEIVRQLCDFRVGQIILCDQSETAMYELCMELEEKCKELRYVSKVSDVQDYTQVKHIIEKYKPQYIYHAAAYKHVPLMEDHPCEAVMTNLLGTKNLIDLAVSNGVEAFVLVSTDKAVNPSNVMGASKRLAEIYAQSLYEKLKETQANPMRVITTRFGNVLGSSGSVIPLFKRQIEKGGPLTVTDEKIIRYFMTIREACRLVLDAGNFGKGGDVFLFDMGDPVKIKELAERMIRLAGYEPYQEMDIVFTGLRPGEKLYEELLYDQETVRSTHNRKIMTATVRQYDYDQVSVAVDQLIKTAYTYNKLDVVKRMKEIVPEFKSQNSIYSCLDSE